jgi:hypothetical protein
MDTGRDLNCKNKSSGRRPVAELAAGCAGCSSSFAVSARGAGSLLDREVPFHRSKIELA